MMKQQRRRGRGVSRVPTEGEEGEVGLALHSRVSDRLHGPHRLSSIGVVDHTYHASY
jgi:hypothetical protein